MTETFKILVDPVFEAVVAFLATVERGQTLPMERQRAEFVKALEEASNRAAAASATDAASFARVYAPLVYLIDEVATTARWPHAEQWPNSILEETLFRTRDRFHLFWENPRPGQHIHARQEGANAAEAEKAAILRERACRAKRESYRGDDALEAIFQCVALGFRGQNGLDPPELLAWVARVRSLIETEHAKSSEAKPTPWGLGPLLGDWLLVRASWLVSASVILALIGFMAAVHAGLNPR